MSDSLFVLKTDFDMITYELRDKTEFLAQNMMRLILDVEQIKRLLAEHSQTLAEHSQILAEHSQILAEHSQILAEHSQELKLIKADINKMDAKLDLIIKHLKI